MTFGNHGIFKKMNRRQPRVVSQLESAIRYLMDKMSKEPMSMPTMPAFPVKEKR